MFIDTHCHISMDDYENIDRVIEENRLAGIEKIIISGCTRESILEALDFSNKYEDVYATLGYHPSEANVTTSQDIILLEEQIKNNKVVGIGEIGLDYHYGKEDQEIQQELFRKQLVLASHYKLPVVIHSRDAVQDTISILKEFPDVQGVIHCFSGSVETAQIYISMGYYLGIGGVVTFHNSKLGEVVKDVGLNFILLETDSPYLAPVPYRGKVNSSKYIPIIAQKIADIFDISLNDVSEVTLKNTNTVFDFK